MSVIDERVDFHQLLNDFFHHHFANQSNLKERQKAWNHFEKLTLPTRKNNAFNYVQLRRLYRSHYHLVSALTIPPDLENYVLPESQESVFIFINGCFVGKKITNLDAKIVALPLSQALFEYRMLLSQRWNEECKKESNPFHSLNLSLHSEGIFVYLPPETIQKAPIQILNILTEESLLSFPRVHLFAARHTAATFSVNTLSIEGEKSGNCSFIDVALEEGAQIHLVQTTQNTSSSAWHFESLQATLKENSRLEVVNATEGSGSTRFDYTIALTGENSEASLNGLSMVDQNKEAHNHILIEHQAPHCRSFQFFKNVLTDRAQTSFEGKIHVHPSAQKTDAYQLNNNLLLSQYAHAHAKPNLDIYADDVKASHGATMGQLNPEELFYLQARGFSAIQAKNLMVHGFCMEIADKIPIPSIRERISAQAHAFLKENSI